MYKIEDYDCFDLTLANGKISSYTDKLSGLKLKSFHPRLAQSQVAKIYILKEGKTYLYVGTTIQSLQKRFRQGFTATGKTGYHGYKWKKKEKVQLFAWCLPGLSKIQIESIEAELAFLIREKTSKWPLAQNEIHFNNDFIDGKKFAKGIFRCTT